MRSDTSIRQNQHLLILSGAIDFGLAALKLVVGSMANSGALIADGIHSLSDLVTDVIVWLFNRIGVQGPDDDHPYGHARFETFGTFLLGALLILVAVGIAYDNVKQLMDISAVKVPEWTALLAAFVSIIVKEWLFRVTRRQGERARSRLLVANAWHHRSDALSSIIVFIGIGGALLGVVWLELVAAVGVALLIARIGWGLARQSVAELVDTAQSGAYVDGIQNTISDVEGVRGVHSIRTRRMGADVLVDVHLQVEPSVSVSEGHHIGEWVTRGLLKNYEEINDIVVHIDAEDDADIEERDQTAPIAPLRREVRTALAEAWEGRINPTDIRKMTLHYLNNGVNVELFLDHVWLREKNIDNQHLRADLLQLGKNLPWLRRVDIWYG